MPRISDIEDKGKEGLDLPGLPWFTRAVGSSLIRGGIYLLAGEPGIGKTTLSLQILGEIARQEVKVLYIPTEQSPADVKRVANRVFKSESPDASREIGTNLFVDTIDDLEMLPWLINHRILPRDSEYNGCQLVVLDSLQGGGLSSAVGKKYRALLSFIGTAKGTGITCMFVNHVTKSGGIAGPKALEHEVDCVVYIRRALRLRPLFVPKNRFGPALLDPLVLIMDEKGLRESPHTSAEANAVFGYSGIGDQFAEA